MQSLQEFHGADTVIACLRWTRIRLRGLPATRAWADEVEAMRQKVRTALDAHDDAVDERAAATVAIEALDKELDAAMARIARRVKDLCDGRLDDPRYVKLFSAPVSEAMRPVVDDSQTLFVRAVVQRIAQDAAYVDVRRVAEDADQRLTALLAAATDRQQLYTTEAVANADLKATCDEARRLYNGLPARLEILFGDRPEFIDSFFRKLAARAKAPAGAAPGPAEPQAT